MDIILIQTEIHIKMCLFVEIASRHRVDEGKEFQVGGRERKKKQGGARLTFLNNALGRVLSVRLSIQF